MDEPKLIVDLKKRQYFTRAGMVCELEGKPHRFKGGDPLRKENYEEITEETVLARFIRLHPEFPSSPMTRSLLLNWISTHRPAQGLTDATINESWHVQRIAIMEAVSNARQGFAVTTSVYGI